MDVIAEGAETPQELEQLRSLQCEYGQGYFFSKPVNSQAAEKLLAAHLQW
jgi:EAL domain-containing protein (putative c-di-GMP-specific phosphodiesterase class I)